MAAWCSHGGNQVARQSLLCLPGCKVRAFTESLIRQRFRLPPAAGYRPGHRL